MRKDVILLSLLLGFSLLPLPVGTTPQGRIVLETPPTRGHVEFGLRILSPSGSHTYRGRSISQVNVDSSGLNIVGDAANEPSLTFNPLAPNEVAVNWRQFDSITSDFREAGLGITSDGGQTWIMTTLDNGKFRSDPVMRRSEKAGLWLYCSLNVSGGNYNVHFFKASEIGLNWSNPIYAYGSDKEWCTVDNWPNSVGYGNIYMSYSTLEGENFTRSTTDADTWMSPIAIPNGCVWGQLDVSRDGTLHLAGLASPAYSSSSFRYARSSNAKYKDQTPTFDLLKNLNMGGTLEYGSNVNPIGLMGQVNISCDRSPTIGPKPIYVLCSVNPPDSDPCDVHIIRSLDNGNSWSSPLRVNSVRTGYQWLAAMDVAPNGRIDVVWYDTQNDPTNKKSQLYYSFSFNGGMNWAPAQPITDPFDHTLGYPGGNNKMGDYIDIQSDYNDVHVAFTATFNLEQDVYYVRIRVPGRK